MNKIPGTLLYVQVQRPVKAYQAAGTPAKPDEWKASVAVTDEDFIDEFEEYVNKIGAKVSLKKVKTAEFESKYKVSPPQGAGKNVWVLTFKKSTELGKTGKPVPDIYKPKVFEKVGNSIVDITNSKLPANGSQGIISIESFERTNGTASLYLKNVLVTDMIEYIREEKEYEQYQPGNEFDDADDGSGGTVKVPAKAAKASVKAKSVPALEEMEDDVPF
jgi:hypothetical protein